MKFKRNLRRLPTLLAAVLVMSTASSAATQYEPNVLPFTFDFTSFTGLLKFDIKDAPENLTMPMAVMRERLERSQSDETIEPLTVLVGASEAGIASVADKLALSGKEEAFSAYLRRHMQISPDTKTGAGDAAKTVEIDESAFALIDTQAFADMYSKSQHNLTLDSGQLKANRRLRAELLSEVSPFFTKIEKDNLQSKINKGQTLEVNTDLLPEFPKKMLKKYIIYRGPNCFHAALAFQSPLLPSSSLINVKQEVGYHRAMINYDELWRVLKHEFYEVDPQTQPLKYGDMMVLFDVPEDLEQPVAHIDFRWIRHTATYLFDGYTFSKGSKSPNTPYTVRTFAEEWKTWKHFTKNLALKVYRRSLKSLGSKPPVDLTDWIY